MTAAIPLADYFRDAPWYRPNRDGAEYKIKSPKDPYSPGLWIADKAQTIRVAEKDLDYLPPGAHRDENSYPGTFFEPTTVAEARRTYNFRTVEVLPGDAVIDDYMPVLRQRSWDEIMRSLNDDINIYEQDFNEGALIRLHIPHDEFRAGYEFDGDVYRKKKFRMKFAPEDAFVLMPDGSIEQVKKHSEVFLADGKLTTDTTATLAGDYDRMICGQPLEVFLETAAEIFGTPDNRNAHLQMLSRLTGHVKITVDTDGEKHTLNPYHSMKAIWNGAKEELARSGVRLAPEQRADFDAHYDDILRRYYYFEKHPL